MLLGVGAHWGVRRGWVGRAVDALTEGVDCCVEVVQLVENRLHVCERVRAFALRAILSRICTLHHESLIRQS